MELMTTGSKLFSAPCNQLGSSNRGLHRHKPAKLHTSPGSQAHGCLPPCRGARRCAACPASAATQCGLWGHPAPDHSAAPPAAAAAGPACHAGPAQAGALQQDTAETGQQGSCSALLHAWHDHHGQGYVLCWLCPCKCLVTLSTQLCGSIATAVQASVPLPVWPA